MKRITTLLLCLFAAVAESLHRLSFDYMRRMGLLLTMAAHTAVEFFTDGSGTSYAISATLPSTYDAAGYGATSITYTAIGKPQSFLPYGSQRGIQEFVPLNGSVEYGKSVPRFGQGDFVCGDVPADAGQVIVKAAEASANHYTIKITYPDTEIHYLDVIVASWTLSGGADGAPLTRTATMGICREPVIVAAT